MNEIVYHHKMECGEVTIFQKKHFKENSDDESGFVKNGSKYWRAKIIVDPKIFKMHDLRPLFIAGRNCDAVQINKFLPEYHGECFLDRSVKDGIAAFIGSGKLKRMINGEPVDIPLSMEIKS